MQVKPFMSGMAFLPASTGPSFDKLRSM